jgi:hypothetical protein
MSSPDTLLCKSCFRDPNLDSTSPCRQCHVPTFLCKSCFRSLQCNQKATLFVCDVCGDEPNPDSVSLWHPCRSTTADDYYCTMWFTDNVKICEQCFDELKNI